MTAAMNNANWEDLRQAMDGLAAHRPKWRAKDISGYLSAWDGEWFDHFRNEGYASIEWVELHVASSEQRAIVPAALREIHLPGEETEHGFRIYGYRVSMVEGVLDDLMHGRVPNIPAELGWGRSGNTTGRA